MASRTDGILVIDKPGGMTSRQVVSEVSGRLGRIKAGHAGTLDPMATGVLVVCAGQATKLSSVLTADDKAYEGELELGACTDTLDADGEVVAENRAAAARVTVEQVRAAMAEWLGEHLQTPPMYSAVRVGGRRLHQAARAGEDIDRPARLIRVDRFELLSAELPRVRFAVACSKGTYVRQLASDVGQALACGAHLTALRRTRSGPFTIEQAIPLAKLDEQAASDGRVAPARALAHLPQVAVEPRLLDRILVGKPLKWDEISTRAAPSGPICILGAEGGLAALIEVAPTGVIRYNRVFPKPLT